MNVPALLRPAILLVAITTVSCSGTATSPTPPPPTQLASPTSTAGSTVLVPNMGSLDPGRYSMTTANGWTAVPFSFTLPAGWSVDNDGIISKETDLRQHQLAFTAWEVSHVFGDACAWAGNLVDVGTTADQMADALAVQEGRDPPVDTDITLDGYPGRLVQLSSGPDFDGTACDHSFMRVWPDPGPDLSGGQPSSPGQTELVYMLDVAGARAVILAYHGAAVEEDALGELQAVIDSITFETAS
jgi:hypothetical protein